jgi:anti-sigma factor ChrR (cupin superfamily)
MGGALAPPAAAAAAPRPLVLADLYAVAADPNLAWDRLAPGVDIHRLYQWPAGQSAALLRYAPGARMLRHRHVGTEQILVLSGSQSDGDGDYAAGTLVVHPPGTCHAIRSDGGCVVLAIWERPVEFVD